MFLRTICLFYPSFIDEKEMRKNHIEIEFLARSTRNSLIIFRVIYIIYIYVVKFRLRARFFTRVYTCTRTDYQQL